MGAKPADIAAIILAAGSSRRFGSDNKLLAVIEGEPLLRRVVTRFLQSKAGQVLVVTGHQSGLIEAALTGLNVRFVHNDKHLQGMGHTVATGVQALDAAVRCALITPGDLPGLTTHLIDRLISVSAIAGHDRIVHPVLPSGEQRNPVLWPRRFFGELGALTGDSGARGLIQRHKGDVMAVTVDATEAFTDIDRPEDLAAWLRPEISTTLKPGKPT
jgi:molybdenum cofactor cytidylyltransferase